MPLMKQILNKCMCDQLTFSDCIFEAGTSFTCSYREILRFSFMMVIQLELDSIIEEWNTHKIRKCKQGDVVSGIPDELYYLGHLKEGNFCRCCNQPWIN